MQFPNDDINYSLVQDVLQIKGKQDRKLKGQKAKQNVI